ncbi:MAG: DMT family transporter [Pseudomonadota bacterium]
MKFEDRIVGTHALGVVLVLASDLAFSLAGVLAKWITADAWTISCWRGLVGGFLITAYVAWLGRRNPFEKTFRLGWSGWFLATVGSAASLAFIFAFKLTYVANVAIIYATVPFIAAALGWWLLGERIKRPTAVAASICVGGVAIIVHGGVGSKSLLGDGVALLMTAGNAVYMVLVRLFHNTPVVFAGAVSALQLFLISWLFVDPLSVTSEDGWMLVLFGLSFAVAVILWTEGTRLIAASEAGLLGTAETPFATILAWLLLSELPPLPSFVGGALVLAAVFAHATRDLQLSKQGAQSNR